MHTRESEQKTKWLDQNPHKNINNIFKIKNQILHAHYIFFFCCCCCFKGRKGERKRAREGWKRKRKEEVVREGRGKRKKEKGSQRKAGRNRALQQSPTSCQGSVRGQSILVLCGAGGDGLVDKACLTLCDPMDCSPPSFSVHGISQARILELPFPSPGIFPTQG